MAGRRLLYLAALAGCSVFYIAYGEWLSWFLLVIALALPWFSLALSLIPIISFRLSPAGPDALEMGQEAELWLLGSCRFPMPPFLGRLRLRRCFTGETRYYREPGQGLFVHCGAYTVTVERGRVCDYLGLFSFPVRKSAPRTMLIRPIALPVRELPDLERFIARSWKPKYGGGYAENHELRLYRPGDSLNQIHWKLSAKSGKLILRQPMEPHRGTLLLTLHLRGTPEELDRKLGRLLWIGNHLLERNLTFHLRVLAGTGILTYQISTSRALKKAVDTLLCQPCAADGDLRQQEDHASWRYHIGGEPDEA